MEWFTLERSRRWPYLRWLLGLAGAVALLARRGAAGRRSDPAILNDGPTARGEYTRSPAKYDGPTCPSAAPEGTVATAGFQDGPDFRSELKMESELYADGASRQLDAIRAGGHALIINARRQMGLALGELDEGDFGSAMMRLDNARNFVGPLANAQSYIAIAEGSRLVRASDVEVGMTLTDVGEVTEVQEEQCGVMKCPRHVTLKIGGQELGSFHGDQELYVVDGE